MSAFLSPLDTRLLDERKNIHQLLAPFGYTSGLLSQTIVVPAGFKTDYASVPRILGAYLLVGGKGKRAAVIHDYLYSGGLAVPRDVADRVFAEALLASGYEPWETGLMYAGVWAFGGFFYDKPNLPQEPQVAMFMEAP